MDGIVAGLSAVAKGLEIAKALRDVDRSMEGASYRAKVADLIDQLTDAKIALSEAKETIAELESEIRRINEVKSGVMEVRRKDGFSFGIENGAVLKIPFCPTCEKQSGQQIQFSELGSGTAYCSVCKRVEQNLPSPPPL